MIIPSFPLLLLLLPLELAVAERPNQNQNQSSVSFQISSFGSLPSSSSSDSYLDLLARSVLQGGGGDDDYGGGSSAAQLLAVRNDRIDPLNNFSKYKGGYNIRNKHYWVSTLFTGIYGYSVAILWCLIGLLYGVSIGCKRLYRCCSDNKHQNSTYSADKEEEGCNSYLCTVAPLIAFIILTAFVIACCSIIYVGNQRFHNGAKQVERIVFNAANSASHVIENVTQNITIMENEVRPYDEASAYQLNSTAQKLTSDVTDIQATVNNNKGHITAGIMIMYISIIAVASTNIIFAVFIFACILLHWQSVLKILLILCWILVILDWLSFSLCFAINNFVDDTCMALKEYEKNSYNSTLDAILPCVALESANEAVSEARQKFYDAIMQMNGDIASFNERLREPHSLLPYVCNPFSGPPNYSYISEGSCPDSTIPLTQVSKILKAFRCLNASDNSTRECLGGEIYQRVMVYATLLQGSVQIIPSLDRLTNCSFVVDTFTLIEGEQCNPMKSSMAIIWITHACLSTLMLFLHIWTLLYTWKAFSSSLGEFKRTSTIIPLEFLASPPSRGGYPPPLHTRQTLPC